MFGMERKLTDSSSDARALHLTSLKFDHSTLLGSLSTRVLETRTATGREHFAHQRSDFSRIFILIMFNGEKILSNVNVG